MTNSVRRTKSIGSRSPNPTPGKLSLRSFRTGKARTGILLWLLGVPIPLVILFFLIKSCVGGG